MNILRFGRWVRRVAVALTISILILVGVLALAATRMGPESAAKPPVTVSIVMGYTPNVQFAPFYAAQKLGYYRSAGLNVHFNYATEPDALKLLSEGSTDFVNSGGDEVLTAAASGLHVKYVMTQYSRFPAALFFLKSSGIKKVGDLRGKTIGIPFKAGTSYFGLLALLGENHVPASSVRIEPINYNQVSEVAAHKVDAAMGYATNEPIALRFLGKRIGEFDVWHWANIAGAGVATSNTLIEKNPNQVRAFVQATLKGLRFSIKHPSKAFRICRQSISGLTDLKFQRAVLNRSIIFWKPRRVSLGRADPKVWKRTAAILRKYKVITSTAPASRYFTNRFVG